ncbi:MAG: cytochrome c [Hyphomicrobiaceae bacterium]
MKRRSFRNQIVLAASFVALAFVAPAQAAGDPAAGKKKALMCTACHGANGIATLPEAPNLAGQNATYMIKALHDFKTGERKNAQMSVVVGTLSDQDIADLAAYFASFKIVVETPK